MVGSANIQEQVVMSLGGPRLDARRRRQLAESYLEGGGRYDLVRPGYPADSVDFLIPPGCAAAADVGAGTGKFTRELTARGIPVTAVDPSEDMLAILHRNLPGVGTVAGTAEATGLPDDSVDLVTVAQAWHWCDPQAAAFESHRILRPGGRLALAWNQLDVALPWVHRLSRIMHAGDVYRPDHRPALGPLFSPPEHHATRWLQPLAPAGVIELAKSRSYYRGASAVARATVVANLRWYLLEHLGFEEDSRVELPYITHSWRATRG